MLLVELEVCENARVNFVNVKYPKLQVSVSLSVVKKMDSSVVKARA